jgi:hypothetical protein
MPARNYALMGSILLALLIAGFGWVVGTLNVG